MMKGSQAQAIVRRWGYPLKWCWSDPAVAHPVTDLTIPLVLGAVEKSLVHRILFLEEIYKEPFAIGGRCNQLFDELLSLAYLVTSYVNNNHDWRVYLLVSVKHLFDSLQLMHLLLSPINLIITVGRWLLLFINTHFLASMLQLKVFNLAFLKHCFPNRNHKFLGIMVS